MINTKIRKGFIYYTIAALAITLVSCNFSSVKTFLDEKLENPKLLTLILDKTVEISNKRAFGENTDIKESITEPIKTDPDSISDVGEILTEGLIVNVFEGVVTNFSKPPTICDANYLEYELPKDCSVHYSAELVYPYFHAMSFPETGSWIQMDVVGSYSAIGVQFLGDYADGWALVTIDDIPVWKGYTKFENCDFIDGIRDISEETCHGGFLYYIEIDGLEGRSHSLRVINIGGGETTVAYFGLGKVKK